jgi:CspA family cold shock protein
VGPEDRSIGRAQWLKEQCTPDVFVHHSAIETDGYRSLQDNQRVEYEAVRGAKGPQAEHVRPI